METLVNCLVDLINKYCDEEEPNHSNYPKSKTYYGKRYSMTNCNIPTFYKQQILKNINTSVCKLQYPISKWKDEINNFNLCDNVLLANCQTIYEQIKNMEKELEQQHICKEKSKTLNCLEKNIHSDYLLKE
jgi:hypothetical protein